MGMAIKKTNQSIGHQLVELLTDVANIQFDIAIYGNFTVIGQF